MQAILVAAFDHFLCLCFSHYTAPVSSSSNILNHLNTDFESVYVAYPRIAQQSVDDTTLTIQVIKFLNPTPNTITATQQGILNSPSKFTPTIDPFNVSIYLVYQNGTRAADPFTFIQMPSIHATHGNSTVGINNQVIQIPNNDRLTDYCTAVFTQQNVTNALVGSSILHEGDLPATNVHFNLQTTYNSKIYSNRVGKDIY